MKNNTFWGVFLVKTVDFWSFWVHNTCIDSKESPMQYTLITKTGKIMQFYIKATAELYQQINGGVVFSQQILEIAEKAQKPVDFSGH